MTLGEFILSVLEVFGSTIRGRTLLQKRCFFVGVFSDMEEEIGFQPHYYGPYSPAIDSALMELVALEFVDQRKVGFGGANRKGFEIKRFDYQITGDGMEALELFKKREPQTYNILSINAEKLREAGNLDYLELSVAAKTYFLLRDQGEVSRQQIIQEAQNLGWDLDNDGVSNAVEFLERLEII